MHQLSSMSSWQPLLSSIIAECFTTPANQSTRSKRGTEGWCALSRAPSIPIPYSDPDQLHPQVFLCPSDMAWYPGDSVWLHDQVLGCSSGSKHGPCPAPGWLLDLWGHDWPLPCIQVWPSDQKNCPCHHHNNGERFIILEHCARRLEYLVGIMIVFKLGKLLCVYIC